MQEAPHIPVLLHEVLEAISPKDNGVYIDATFGAGGYTRAVLEAANCEVFAIDRDPDAIKNGQALVEKYTPRLTLIEGPFSQIKALLKQKNVSKVDGIMLDIGVSSMQIDQAQRGFSFQKDGPLDMRMSQKGLSAAEVVNTYSEEEIADILYTYGQERFSRKIAKAIVLKRKEKPFQTTLELANVVRSVIFHKKDEIHPATRTFQGLRIYVNDELEQLRSGLSGAEELLKQGARMAVVSFHSLEDRIVKKYVQEKSGKTANPSRHLPEQKTAPATLKQISKKPITPSKEECQRNPRARSARLRIAESL